MITKIRRLMRSSKLVRRAYRWLMGEDAIMLGKDLQNHISAIITDTGDKYIPSRNLVTFLQVQEDYHFDDIRENDIVIDIGACIGGFSIPAAKMSRCVYAIEPITVERLRENIALNGRDITVLVAALGDGQPHKISWENQHRYLRTLTLERIKEICGGCDFLKVDCEGCEWAIRPEELKGIRRIEMEVHKIKGLAPGTNVLEQMGKKLETAGFSYIKGKGRGNSSLSMNSGIIHAWRFGSKPPI